MLARLACRGLRLARGLFLARQPHRQPGGRLRGDLASRPPAERPAVRASSRRRDAALPRPVAGAPRRDRCRLGPTGSGRRRRPTSRPLLIAYGHERLPAGLLPVARRRLWRALRRHRRPRRLTLPPAPAAGDPTMPMSAVELCAAALLKIGARPFAAFEDDTRRGRLRPPPLPDRARPPAGRASLVVHAGARPAC